MSKTFDLQSQLPPLPLPTLQDTCNKYLDSVKPFLTKDEFMETGFKVELFQNGIGKELHNKLMQLAKHSKNWAQDRWYDSYFDYRGSNPMMSNISGGYESRFDFDQPCHGLVIERAANWIHSMTTIYQRVVKQEVPVQKLGRQFPMDMSQYANFFCGSRLPGEKRDTLMHNIHLLPQPDGSMHVVAPSKHIVVMKNAHIFHVKVIDDNNVILHPKSIQRQLERIHEICKDLEEGEGVAALTMGTRDKWYKAYKHLCILDRQNKTNINLINQSIFAFAFEDVETHNLQEATEHGILGGLSKNRWFDKSCQAVIGTTGVVITTEDHVHFDGNVGCQILQDCADYLTEHKFDIQPGYEPQQGEEPVEIVFTVDDTIRDYIKEAVHLHGLISSSLGLIDKPIEHYGKAFAKTVRINPDTVFQMAMQLAYYSLNKSVCPTYESGTTRMFYHGRTETNRSCTVESKEWCEAMFNNQKTGPERLELFRKAVQKHDTLMLDACQGKGIDRHLFLLKKISEEEGIPLPDIYIDKAYKASGGDGNFVISSSLTGFTVLHGGMAPMVEDGYGIFYSINKDRTQVVLSSWKTSQKTDHLKMYDAIVSSLDKIKELCQLSKM